MSEPNQTLDWNDVVVPEWELHQGIQLARQIENALRAQEIGAHVAMGGSVLMKGQSQKDVDIFFYPRSERDIDIPTSDVIIDKVLRPMGFENFQTVDVSEYGVYKEIQKAWLENKRVDFIFLLNLC